MSDVLAVTLVDVQERDRVGVGRRRRNVAEDFVEAVAVEVRKTHVRELARAGGQVREAHLVQVPDRIAAAAGTRVDAAERLGRSRQSSSFTIPNAAPATPPVPKLCSLRIPAGDAATGPPAPIRDSFIANAR